MQLTDIVDRLKQLAVPDTRHDIAIKAINRITLFKILKGVVISQVDPAFLDLKPGFTGRFLKEPELRKLSADPELDISPDFLDRALPKGDQCYGIFDGDKLASMGWYSQQPTSVGIGDLELCFSKRYVYMYKGLTLPAYRGFRLHAIGMTRALDHYLHAGLDGVISYVESNNFASLKSCYRMGYRDFGQIYVGRLPTRFVSWSDPGSKGFGFRLAPARNRESHTAH